MSTMKKTRKDITQKSPVLLKVSRSGPKRIHIEIPQEHRDKFGAGDHVWVQKVEAPSSVVIIGKTKIGPGGMGRMLQGVAHSLGADKQPTALPVKLFKPAFAFDYDKKDERLLPSRKPKRSKDQE